MKFLHFEKEDGTKVSSVKMPGYQLYGYQYDRDYFEDNFNTKRWFREVELYAQDIIEEGDEVSLPRWLEEKYFKNGINCAYIIP